MQQELLMEMSDAEVALVSGGDSWAGTPEGRASANGGNPTLGQFCLATGVAALILAVALR